MKRGLVTKYMYYSILRAVSNKPSDLVSYPSALFCIEHCSRQELCSPVRFLCKVVEFIWDFDINLFSYSYTTFSSKAIFHLNGSFYLKEFLVECKISPDIAVVGKIPGFISKQRLFMMQCPFSLWLCQHLCFTGFQMIFILICWRK